MGAEPPRRVAVAGLGGIGLMRAGHVVQHPGAELVAVASGTPERAAEVASSLGPDVRPCSYEQLAAAQDVDAVILCSRAREHVRHAVPLLEAGRHVLLEKPGATTLADHDRLHSAAQAAGGSLLQVGYMRRFDPLFREARRRVAAGDIGQPLLVLTISRDTEFPPGEDPADTGGFLLDMAVHDYDIACWILEQRPVRVAASRQGLVHPELLAVGDMDNAVVTVTFDGGGIAATHISRTCTFGHDIRAEIVGTEGSIFVGNGAGAGDGVSTLDVRDADGFPIDYRDRFLYAFQAELADFLDRCAGSGPSRAESASLQSDRHAVEIGVAARASAVQERPLAVGEDWAWP
jgi:scyllo-inositol 2-dehydrogenase (NAD+)